MHRSILILQCKQGICPSWSIGIVVTLTKNSFHVHQHTHKSSVDTSIHSKLHQEPCGSIIADQSIRDPDHPSHLPNPNVFVSSCDTLSSWEERRRDDGVAYYLNVSRIPLTTAQRVQNRKNPSQGMIFSRISPCKTAIAVCINCSDEIVAVAKNLGLSHCTYQADLSTRDLVPSIKPFDINGSQYFYLHLTQIRISSKTPQCIALH